MKKGQTEIIGLAIVVILLIFALVFFVQVRNSEEDKGTKLIRSNLRANSAMNALMKVHIGDEQMKDLIEECYANDEESCNAAYAGLRDNLIEIFELETSYYFVVREGEGEDILFNDVDRTQVFKFGQECERGVSASPFIFRDQGKAEFKVCV